MDIAAERRRILRLDTVILCLVFFGILLAPMHLRAPLLQKPLGNLQAINFPCALAVLLSLFRFRRWTKAETLLAAAWLLLVIPVCVSNTGRKDEVPVTAILQLVLPLFLLLFRPDPAVRRKALGVFLLCFDVFMGLYLVLGLVEHFTNLSVLTQTRDALSAAGYKPSEITRYLAENDGRFASVWAHPLTGAFLFNGCFVLNALWLKTARTKKWVIFPVFAACFLGVLLCSSKMGIVISFLLLAVTCWEYRKWFLLLIPVLVGLYFTGLFDRILWRFTEIDLTSGRLEDLRTYFASGVSPLMFFSGYGSSAALISSNPVNAFNNAFESPLMMLSFDYGILYMLVAFLGAFAYVSFRLLRRKKWTPWLCYGCLFAEISAYNAYALRNQDVCWLMCLFSLWILNLADGES